MLMMLLLQGPRNCIGMRLALIEAKMALASILQKFTVVPGEKTEVRPKAFLHRKKKLDSFLVWSGWGTF